MGKRLLKVHNMNVLSTHGSKLHVVALFGTFAACHHLLSEFYTIFYDLNHI